MVAPSMSIAAEDVEVLKRRMSFGRCRCPSEHETLKTSAMAMKGHRTADNPGQPAAAT
jgi:hypothetical protein